MLYDDIQQLEVRYVISLEYHDVDVYGGGEPVPEGELYIKRHSIRLKRKHTQTGGPGVSLPFFLFGQSQSDKEDFYHAILKNQEKSIAEDPPTTQLFNVNDAVLLVQKLHSSEEHLQTRWLNAMIGRVFLALYKTPELEGFIREKLTKKMSRVKKPTFITKLGLRSIDLGTSAPFFTNPRLRDLTINGDCMIEADFNYTGGLRIEIAATARIDLGTRFKAREVDMVLAVSCKKLEGHILVRCKPPPSNRLWFTFEKMPQLDLSIEPIVSSRQITYTFILRAIETRIREVFAESIVHPFWDDVPFFDTRHQKYRGGIWKKDTEATTTVIPDEEPEDLAEGDSSGTTTPAELSKDGRVMSMPIMTETNGLGKSNAAKRSMASLNDVWGKKKPEPMDRPEAVTPRLLRGTSYANAADPTITVNNADANTPTRSPDPSVARDSIATTLKGLSTRSTSSNQSDSGSLSETPPAESSMAMAMKGRTLSNASGISDDSRQEDLRRRSSSLPRTLTSASQTSLPASEMTTESKGSRPSSVQEKKPGKNFAFGAKSLTAADRKQAIASVSNAAVAAQKWGWGVLARNRQREAQAVASRASDGASNGAGRPREPMGRGRPLPPPGVPLPLPERNSFLAPKRKPVPPPLPPKRPLADEHSETISAEPSPKPPLPERRKRQGNTHSGAEEESEVLVVEAPMDSAPTSPVEDEHHDDFFSHGEPAASIDEQMEPSNILEGSESIADPTATVMEEEPVKPSLPARAEEEHSSQGDESEEVGEAEEIHQRSPLSDKLSSEHQRPPLPERRSIEHQRPPLPERRNSELSPPLPNEGDELKRQELGMYVNT